MTRQAIEEHGSGRPGRCNQCGTCSAVCRLAREDAPFPRQQMLWAQWSCSEQLERDPAMWLCYRCNDCTDRCPRDARPTEVLHTARMLMIEDLAWPRSLGRLVSQAARTWAVLLGLPILLWVGLLALIDPTVPANLRSYSQVVPRSYVYVVYSLAAGFSLLCISIGARKLWKRWSEKDRSTGPYARHVLYALKEIATHRRFGKCSDRRARRWGHACLVYGFVGAVITSALMIVALYVLDRPLPLPQTHPIKLLGNVSAAAMILGIVMLVTTCTTAFDAFFLALISLVVVSGTLVEIGRYMFDPRLACWLYIVHLGSVLCLFITFPFSKFSHFVYHTMAIVHEHAKGAQDAQLREPN